MSRMNKPPLGFSSSGRSKARIVTIVAGAALFGTVVGGASAVGVVMAIVQPPAHDARADAVNRAATSLDAPAQAQAAPPSDKPITATASAQDPPAAPAPQPEETATTQQPAPSKTWPDALSARTDRGRADPPSIPQVVTAAPDLSGSRQDDEHTAQDREAPPVSEPTVAERAPWPNPLSPRAKAMKRHAVVASEPVPPAAPTTSAEPTAPSVAADDTNTAPTNKTRDDVRKPRLTQQQQPPQSRDAMDQSRDDREPAAYPPRQRVIVLAPPPPPPPERDAGMDRDHHGNGLFGLFDFAGHDHWNEDHWGNDRWHDQHD